MATTSMYLNFPDHDEVASWLWHHDYVMVADSSFETVYENPYGVQAIIRKSKNHVIQLISHGVQGVIP
jgi:hypothetical protein